MIKKFLNRLKKLLKSADEGVVAIIYVVALIPLFGMLGLAIDGGRDFYVHSVITGAADAASIAGAKAGGTQDNMRQRAIDIFNANIPDNFIGTISGPTVQISQDSKVVTVTATASIDTTFMKLLGQNSISATATSQANVAIQGAEVVLALDNTGSMAGGPMSDEIVAARTLVNILYGGPTIDTVPGLYVGVVPYTTTVNINMSGFNPTSWLTTAGQAQVQNLNLFPNIPSTATNVGGRWMGCIEARAPRPLNMSATTYSNFGYTNYAAGMDTSDTPPTSDATRFVPFFYPSTMAHGYVFNQPVNRGTTSSSTNALATAGSPPWGTTGSTRGDNDWRLNGTVPTGSGLRFGDNWALGGSDGNFGVGPNLGCPISLLPLTTSQQTVQNKISNMKATFRGGTMINVGLNTAWWMLSPEWRGRWPGTDSSLPKNYGDTLKVIVLMTDGQNQWYDWPTGVPGQPASQNYRADADYTGFGRLAEGRSGTTSFGSTVGFLNTRMLNMCTTIKNNGIVIYTIIYTHGGSISEATQTAFQSCATDPSKYFFAATSAEMQAAFQNIGRDIANLRLTWPGKP